LYGCTIIFFGGTFMEEVVRVKIKKSQAVKAGFCF